MAFVVIEPMLQNMFQHIAGVFNQFTDIASLYALSLYVSC